MDGAANGTAMSTAQLLAYQQQVAEQMEQELAQQMEERVAMLEQQHRDELDELEQQLCQARIEAGERGRGHGGEVLGDVIEDDGAGPDEGSGEPLSDLIDDSGPSTPVGEEMPGGVVSNEAPLVSRFHFSRHTPG